MDPTLTPTAPQAVDFRRPVYCLLGLPVDAVSMDEAVERIHTAVSSRSPCFLSTPNLNFLIASQRDAAFRDSVIRSDLSVADGMPLVWIARLLGAPIRERVAGSDLFEALLSGRALGIYFFGGPDGAARAAGERINALAGPVRCVGHAWPGTGSVEDMSGPDVIARINASGADFVVVALGARKGQAWIERNRDRLHAPVVSHLGAVVNFAAGTLARAPARVRGLGLEWLWRIKEEPALWRRYSRDALALARLVLTKLLPGVAWRALLSLGPTRPAALAVITAGRSIRLQLSGSWPDAELPALRAVLESVTRRACDIDVELSRVTRVGAGLMGTLMLLYGHQARIGRRFHVVADNATVRWAFALNCAAFLLHRPVAQFDYGVPGNDGARKIPEL